MHGVLHRKLLDLPRLAAAPAAWEAFWRQHPGEWAGLNKQFLAQASAPPEGFLIRVGAGTIAADEECSGGEDSLVVPEAAVINGQGPQAEVAAAAGAQGVVGARRLWVLLVWCQLLRGWARWQRMRSPPWPLVLRR